MNFLNLLPGNGYKRYIGLFLAALVMGLQQMGRVDQTSAAHLLEWLAIWTGVAFAHNQDKTADVTDLVAPVVPAV